MDETIRQMEKIVETDGDTWATIITTKGKGQKRRLEEAGYKIIATSKSPSICISIKRGHRTKGKRKQTVAWGVQSLRDWGKKRNRWTDASGYAEVVAKEEHKKLDWEEERKAMIETAMQWTRNPRGKMGVYTDRDVERLTDIHIEKRIAQRIVRQTANELFKEYTEQDAEKKKRIRRKKSERRRQTQRLKEEEEEKQREKEENKQREEEEIIQEGGREAGMQGEEMAGGGQSIQTLFTQAAATLLFSIKRREPPPAAEGDGHNDDITDKDGDVVMGVGGEDQEEKQERQESELRKGKGALQDGEENQETEENREERDQRRRFIKFEREKEKSLQQMMEKGRRKEEERKKGLRRGWRKRPREG